MTTARAAAAAILALALAASLYGLPLLSVAANRLALGTPAFGAAAGGGHVHAVAGLGLAGLALLAAAPGRVGAALALPIFGAAVLLLAAGLGAGATALLDGRPTAARASVGSGGWCAVMVLLAAAGWSVRAFRMPGFGAIAIAGLAAGLTTLARSGTLDHLSLAVEFRARHAVLGEAIVQHLVLAGGALVLACLCAVTMSLWRRGQGLVEVVVSGIQVVPAVALFGALVGAFSAVLSAVPSLREAGLSALGPGPAILGIAAYLLLPLWRGLAAGLGGTPATLVDAAEAVGLGRRQVLLSVRLPLGAPVLVGALRVAAVQSLGLATLGALVGAGGLGRIVFDGMAQFAPDLILLGALPIVGLSLAADAGLGAAEAMARRRWHS
ncbi:ABC transporter permease subunit [Methylobacterium sp. Leaf466]|uniref:ABC transporter permease n=1 Tax=Methylobacterium sp. Leaf466 TaxID=1736386 RepID=UPI0006FCEC2B|nr:ABC transporter permease subunit [Methylobacterium sp. Leaf466]KQT84225.1 hypothetical protein ASG59_02140 [Methylobacterium sp. Leaf466]